MMDQFSFMLFILFCFMLFILLLFGLGPVVVVLMRRKSERRGKSDPKILRSMAQEKARDLSVAQQAMRGKSDRAILLGIAREKAREIFDAGHFTEDFTHTVFRALRKDSASRLLYEKVTGADICATGIHGKGDLNKVLAKAIKSEIGAETLYDENNIALRKTGIVGEAIQGCTLFTLPSGAQQAESSKSPAESRVPRAATKNRAYRSSEVRNRALRSLREAFERHWPATAINGKGYTNSYRDNLLSFVALEDFEDDLRAGVGKELENKFCAAHSSAALAVNCFAPFKPRIADLAMQEGDIFEDLRFEYKCPTGLLGIPPHLDVMLFGPGVVVGIESKLTEYLTRHSAEFSPSYNMYIRDKRRDQGYFREMLRLMSEPDSYMYLDAAQLIKHAFGLSWMFRRESVTLLYIYWEPLNPESDPVFAQHRREVSEFAKRVEGSTPTFRAMSYDELWSNWRASESDWLSEHLDELSARYLVRI